jgi:hypothetical protein
MDHGQPPSTAPTPTPASHPGDISPALPGSPETQPAPPTATAPTQPGAPQDPYASYANLDYEGMLAEFPVETMNVAELKTVFGPAHSTIAQFGAPGLVDALESSGAGSDANILRGLAAVHRDYQQLLSSVKDMNSRYQAVSQQLGRSVSAISTPPPLTGDALDREMSKFVDRYFPTTATRDAYARGFADEPAVLQTLTRAVQEFSRLERSLHQASTQRQQLEAQREAPSALRTLPDGRRYTVEDLDLEYGRLWQEWHEAERKNDLNAKARLKVQMERIGRARWGG